MTWEYKRQVLPKTNSYCRVEIGFGFFGRACEAFDAPKASFSFASLCKIE